VQCVWRRQVGSGVDAVDVGQGFATGDRFL
jgi:hypothetical protein